MRRAFVLASLLAVFSSSVQARADGDPATSGLSKQVSKEHFYRGLKLYDRAEYKKDPVLYEQAYLEFVRAWAAYKTDKVLWNLGLSALHSSRSLDALNYFKEYDRRYQVLGNPKHADHDVLERYIAQASALTAHATVEADPGARIVVDGKPIGSAPLADSVDLLPGHHVFEAGDSAVEATIEAGGVYIAKLRSDARATAPTTAMDAPRAAAANAAPPDSAASAMTGSTALASPSSSGTRIWITAGLGVTSAALVASGIYFAAHSSSAANDAAAARTSMAPGSCPASGCAGIDDAIATSRSARTTSIVLSTLGIAAAAGAVVSWIVLRDGAPNAEKASVSPLLAPGLVGAQLTKNF